VYALLVPLPLVLAMSAPAAEEMSKSARKRANQKARAAEAEVEAPAPEPAPKSKAAAKQSPKAKAAPAPQAAEPKAKAKGKAKAEPKAAEPAPKAPEPKAKAKGKAKAEPKAVAEPKQAAEPKAEPKKASKKAAAKKVEKEPEPEKKASNEPLFVSEIDDGKGGEWEVSSGLSKQAERRQRKELEKEALAKEAKAIGVAEARAGQNVPGLAPASVQVAAGKKGAAKLSGKDLVSQAVDRVAVVTAAAAAAATSKAPEAAAAAPSNDVSAVVKVPEAKIGRVVGPKGANIIMIKEKTGVKTIDMSGDDCTILGPPDAVALAEHAVRQLVEKGYMSLAFEDFEEEGVSLHPSIFPDIIGKGGAIIIAIKKEAKVEIDIPAVPKNGPAGKKYKVMLAGSKQSVVLGKEILNSIALYGHHEITHPGQVHKEMEVEEWRYRYLIGSKGSEMRHIQNNYKVRVNIPREHSECQNVVIIGDAGDVERAVKYIEKIMFEADQPRGRGATEKAADDGYGDEAVEDWMKPYMYQRK